MALKWPCPPSVTLGTVPCHPGRPMGHLPAGVRSARASVQTAEWPIDSQLLSDVPQWVACRTRARLAVFWAGRSPPPGLPGLRAAGLMRPFFAGPGVLPRLPTRGQFPPRPRNKRKEERGKVRLPGEPPRRADGGHPLQGPQAPSRGSGHGPGVPLSSARLRLLRA